MKDFLKLSAFVIFCELVGIAGTPFTVRAIPEWYVGLNKPPFSPPNWIFGPVWTLLYLMMGISAYLVFKKGYTKEGVRTALVIFGVQLFLNFLWSILFFGLRSPLLGLINILALWVMIILTMVKFKQISATATYLLIPYLLWVSFATLLNFSILILNQ